MAKDTVDRKPTAPPPDPGARFLHWLHTKQRPLLIGALGVAVVGLSVWFMFSARSRREAFATGELNQARVAADAGNLQLAASDLGRVVSTYGNTNAGQQAAILLARVHLQQDQPDLAVSELRTFLNSTPKATFVAPAAGLLGGALEQMGQFAEAAPAFRQAAEASEYSLVRAQYFLDAGRAAALAGDTAGAVESYVAAIQAAEDAPSATEAKFRIAELTRSAPPQQS